MAADHSIDRDSGLYRAASVYAFTMFFVYPVGVPCLYVLRRPRTDVAFTWPCEDVSAARS